MTTAWPEVALGEVAAIIMGQAPKGDTYNDHGEGWPLIAGAGDFGPGVPNVKKFTTAPTRISSPGDIVLGIRASIGAKVIADREYCLGRGVAALRGGDALDDRYLWHWLGESADRLAAKGRGATFLQVNRRDIAEMSVLLPPVEEQRRVAAILDTADQIRVNRRECLVLLDSLTESIFLDMFGDPAVNPRSWPVRSIADVASHIQIGPFGSLLHQADYIEGGVPLVNPMHLSNGRIWPDRRHTISPEKARDLATYRLQPGDLVMARRGEMGRCAVVLNEHDGLLCGSGSLFIRPDIHVVHVRYLAAVISSAPVRRLFERSAQGVTMPNLNREIVASMALPIPPIANQDRFAIALSATDRLRRSIERSIADADALFASLQQRAFRGEL